MSQDGPRWYPFDPAKGSRQKRPPLYRHVLVQLPREPGLPPPVAVGYRKNAAGDKQSPYFVVPGIGGVPTHWCDCLGDGFEVPAWEQSRTATAAPSLAARS